MRAIARLLVILSAGMSFSAIAADAYSSIPFNQLKQSADQGERLMELKTPALRKITTSLHFGFGRQQTKVILMRSRISG